MVHRLLLHLYVAGLVQLCVVAQFAGGLRPPPMHRSEIPPNPENQADMMEHRPWAPGPYGYHQNYHAPPHYQQPPGPYYPPAAPQSRYTQQPYPAPQPYQGGHAQIIPLNVIPQYRGPPPPNMHHGPGPPPNAAPMRHFAVQAAPRTISAGKPKAPPPIQNLHTGKPTNRPHPSNIVKNPSNAVKKNIVSTKLKPRPIVQSRPEIKRLPWRPKQVRWQPPPQPYVRQPMAPPPRPRPRAPPPPQQRQPMPLPPQPQPLPPQPVMPPQPIPGPPPPDMGGPLGAGQQDGPCIPAPSRPAKPPSMYPQVRHQPRPSYRRRYRRAYRRIYHRERRQRHRRAVYNLTGCTCTDIQDIDPLGGDNYLTKAGYCKVFQYYCACPSTVTATAGAAAPPPG